MKEKKKRKLILSVLFIIIFLLWTAAVRFIDRKSIGPLNSVVGFSSLNKAFHSFTGVNMTLYYITDWLGLVAIAVCLIFAILGLIQLLKRKSILKVDYDILWLGAFYAVVFGVYLLFECLIINYRPILIDGRLEASYPSSTTLLIMCIIPTAVMQVHKRVKKAPLRIIISIFLTVFAGFVLFARVFSGVHWITDIIGACLFAIGADLGYLYLGDL